MKKRRIIDWRPLAKYVGQTLTAKEILEICGYSPKGGYWSWECIKAE